MTYKEIINRFRSITDDHLMLQDFGYGDLSDLKYVSQLGTEEERVSYPYLYLLPSSSNRAGPVMNYAFNMIIMDMARPEDGADTDKYDNYVTIQSQCQQYIDDVLAQLYYYYKDQPEIALTGITYTPFKEKYQDVVAGMTATISIAVPTPLNECIAPFGPIPGEVYLEVQTPAAQTTLQYNGDLPFAGTIVTDIYNQWDNLELTPGSGIIESHYKQVRFPTLPSTLEFSIDMVLTQAWPVAANWTDYNLYWRPMQEPRVYTGWKPIVATGWPASPPTVGVPFTVTYNGTLPNDQSNGTVAVAENGTSSPALQNFFSTTGVNTMKFTAL
jgi:hypothetical protein